MLDPHPIGQPPASSRLLDRTDRRLLLALIAAALVSRLAYYSGYGLGDDILFRHDINSILVAKSVMADNMAYRFTWWFPTALACRIFGLREAAIVLPITAYALFGIGLVYALGKALWGRAGSVIAALLVMVCPLDFAWSTMMALDICLSVFAAAFMLMVVRAFQHTDPRRRQRAWILAAVSLWLAYHSKVSGVLLIPAAAMICLPRWRALDRTFLTFLTTSAVLLGGSAVVAYAFTGNPLAPYTVEITTQGLAGPEAVQFHRLNEYVFWAYVRWLFRPDAYGHWMYSVYPWLLIVLGASGWLFGLRTSMVAFWWLLFLFVGMQFNIQRVQGVWVAGFRNVRHGHVWIYPMVLLLTGYFVGMRARLPRLTHAALALLLAFGAWQSVATARVTHVAFADRRAACWFLKNRPPKPVACDFQIPTWCGLLDMAGNFHELESFNRDVRRRQIAGITSGYLITGGAREPYYGCIDCIPLANEVDPARWELVMERLGPTKPTAYRAEPLRIWQVREEAPSPSG